MRFSMLTRILTVKLTVILIVSVVSYPLCIRDVNAHCDSGHADNPCSSQLVAYLEAQAKTVAATTFAMMVCRKPTVVTKPGAITCAGAWLLVGLAALNADRKWDALQDCRRAHAREHAAIS